MKNTSSVKETDNLSLLISYLSLRRIIGLLGLSFPFILAFGAAIFGSGTGIQSTISDYYHTNMRDIFVGILTAIGLFLFTYKGHNFIDNLAGNLGCIFAFGVAFVPTDPDNPLLPSNPVAGKVHLIFATLLFVVLIYFSLFLFTKTNKKGVLPPRKRYRNRVFSTCGYSMLGAIILIALYSQLLENRYHSFDELHPVFWLESIALISFGVSWLTKGQLILRDVKVKE